MKLILLVSLPIVCVAAVTDEDIPNPAMQHPIWCLVVKIFFGKLEAESGSDQVPDDKWWGMIMSKWNTDGDDRFSLTEFKAMWEDLFGAQTGSPNTMFGLYDQNNDWYITRGEWVGLNESMMETCSVPGMYDGFNVEI